MRMEGHDNRLITASCTTDRGLERKTVAFTTGAGVTRITVFLARTPDTGEAYADNLACRGIPGNSDGAEPELELGGKHSTDNHLLTSWSC